VMAQSLKHSLKRIKCGMSPGGQPLLVRLEALETTQCRGVMVEDVSNDEVAPVVLRALFTKEDEEKRA
ncbi:hypothetical protein KI387_020784, partial [Taxus chinensis]